MWWGLSKSSTPSVSASEPRGDEWMDAAVRAIEGVEPAGPLVTCTLKAQRPAPFPIQITPSKIILRRNNTIIGGVFLNADKAIRLN
jgi:hypothetical protein